MRKLSAREARQRFKSMLEAAKRGQTTLITQRGKTVARLGPVEPEEQPSLPDLSKFRESIRVKGKPSPSTVLEERRKARF
ncbi:MAG: type II toxin-antitoxin system prevent-host-death family antitoxin [Phycisphaeraceae bacterium]|nr:type II toxin-antitoxin system prevent-host-death family antitoxin [Phycisphaeraceae bacterium]